MGRLIYSMLLSLDGYVEDADGGFGWAEPSEEVHAFANDLSRTVGTFLFGRRMYETMAVWETLTDESPVIQDFAELWRAADKVVYSTTLDAVSTARTRIERSFEPDAVRAMKDSADRDLAVSGPELATHAFRHGLVDECQLFVVPTVVGGGKRAFPDGVRLDLELIEERRFGNGTVYLRYRTK